MPVARQPRLSFTLHRLLLISLNRQKLIRRRPNQILIFAFFTLYTLIAPPATHAENSGGQLTLCRFLCLYLRLLPGSLLLVQLDHLVEKGAFQAVDGLVVKL